MTIYEAAMLVPPFRGANICQAGIKLDKKCGKKWTCQRTGIDESTIGFVCTPWFHDQTLQIHSAVPGSPPCLEIRSFSWSNLDCTRT